MIFELSFLPQALREWKSLDGGIRDQFKKKLAELDSYKIKLRHNAVYRQAERR